MVSLAAHTRLGPYELIAPLGEGGMGEVYRARDTRLGREVAIKVLPAEVATDPDRLRRLEQEARATSALNHPNIVVVHDTGHHEGSLYIVYELLEGVTLREPLNGPRLPVSRVIAYGIEIARGLAAAHDRGVVHRDLKPENLFITRDGRVKILDFGIARLAEAPALTEETMTVHRTAAGVILGTVGYMSPEQVRGERVDARSDIFSLGTVLYELLSGRRPFDHPTGVETMNAVLNEEPADFLVSGGETGAALERIVRHCLEKSPDLRFQSARDVAFALEGVSTRSGPSPFPALPAAGTRSAMALRVAWILAVLGLVSAAILGVLYARRSGGETRAVRFEIAAPANGALQGILGVSSVISPDGQTLAMAVTTESGPRLFLRSLASTLARPLDGTEGASNPFWSPDNRWLGFFAGGKMKRVAVGGGAPETICETGITPWQLATWAPDDTVLFAGYQAASGLFRVPASGGQPKAVLTAPAHVIQSWPSFLPDGRHFLYYELTPGTLAEIRVGSLDSGETKTVLPLFTRALYAESGHLLFVREGTLMAQRFSLDTLSTSGSAMPVAEDLLYLRDLGQSDFSVSRNGVLAYQAGDTRSRLVWFGRNGTEMAQVGEPGDFWFPRLSRDGTKIVTDVMDRRSGTTDIQIFDLVRGGPASSVTVDPMIDWTPVLSPDNRQVAFASARRGAPHVHVKRLNKSGPAEQLVAPTGAVQFVTDWADGPGGGFIIYHEIFPATGTDLMRLPLSGSPTPQPLIQTPGNDTDGRVSPDGRWLAYVSTESGRNEVYVQGLQRGSERWRVSTGGGVSPRWHGNSRELFYLATASTLPFGATLTDARLMAVDLKPTETGLAPATPILLFTARVRSSQYDAASDGTRFLINTGTGDTSLPITVAFEWTKALDR